VVNDPLYQKFWPNSTIPFGKKNADCPSIFAYSEKSSINTDMKSTYTLSLRWTLYVAPEPPMGRGLKNANNRFPCKIALGSKKSATKFLCLKTASDGVVRYSLAYLSVQKWLVGTSPSTWKFGGCRPTPLLNADFQSICARSASAITNSRKL